MTSTPMFGLYTSMTSKFNVNSYKKRNLSDRAKKNNKKKQLVVSSWCESEEIVLYLFKSNRIKAIKKSKLENRVTPGLRRAVPSF